MKKMFFCFLLATGFLAAAPKAVVFDHGGVFTKNEVSEEKMVSFFSKNFTCSPTQLKAIKQEVKKTPKESRNDTDFWVQYAKQLNIKPSNKEWERDFDESFQEPMGINTKMYALVEKLKEKGLTVGVLSNMDSALKAKIMRKLGLYESFEPCLLSVDTGLKKPDPKAYELLLETLKMSASEVVFIDDLEVNVTGAKAVGMDAILFQSHAQVEEELRKRDLI